MAPEDTRRIFEILDQVRQDMNTVKTDMAVLKTEFRSHCSEQSSGSGRQWDSARIVLQIMSVVVPIAALFVVLGRH